MPFTARNQDAPPRIKSSSSDPDTKMSEKSGPSTAELAATKHSKTNATQTLAPPYARSQQLVSTAPTFPAQVRSPRPPHADNSSSVPRDSFYYSPRWENERFVHDELTVKSLDCIADLLWLAGIPGNVRPLARIRSLGRTIIPNEQICFHLTWRDDILFVKPLPSWLLHYDSTASLIWNPEHLSILQSPEDLRRRAYRRAAALGFLMTYVKLIVYESDLELAKQLALVPRDITFLQWTAFATAIVDAAALQSSQLSEIVPRYGYGELRLPRINLIYRLAPRMFPRYLLAGYSPEAARTSTFIARNFYWALTMFLWITVVLQALQVGVSTESGQQDASYQRAAWVLSWLGIGIPAATLLLVALVVVYVVAANTMAAWRRRVRVVPGAGAMP